MISYLVYDMVCPTSIKALLSDSSMSLFNRDIVLLSAGIMAFPRRTSQSVCEYRTCIKGQCPPTGIVLVEFGFQFTKVDEDFVINNDYRIFEANKRWRSKSIS